MTEPLVAFTVGTSIDRALAALQARNISCAPVIDENGAGLGVVSRTDLLRVGRSTARARDERTLLDVPHVGVDVVMSTPIFCVDQADSVASAAQLMSLRHVHRVFASTEGRPMGVFSTKELLKAIIDARIETPIEAFMTQPIVSIGAENMVADAADRLIESKVAGLVVTDREGFIIGLFTQREALRAKDARTVSHVESVMTPSLLFLDKATPLFRAAAHALTMNARSVLATDHGRAIGILTGLDFARAAH